MSTRPEDTEDGMRALELMARQMVRPGETLIVHRVGCAALLGAAPCDCDPLRITVPKETA